MTEKTNGEGGSSNKTPTGFEIHTKKDIHGRDIRFIILRDGREASLEPQTVITRWNIYGKDEEIIRATSFLPESGYAQALACSEDVALLMRKGTSMIRYFKREDFDDGPAVRFFWKRDSSSGKSCYFEAVYRLPTWVSRVSTTKDALELTTGTPVIFRIQKELKNKELHNMLEVRFPISTRGIQGSIETKQWGKVVPGPNYKLDIDAETADQMQEYIRGVAEDIIED